MYEEGRRGGEEGRGRMAHQGKKAKEVETMTQRQGKEDLKVVEGKLSKERH